MEMKKVPEILCLVSEKDRTQLASIMLLMREGVNVMNVYHEN